MIEIRITTTLVISIYTVSTFSYVVQHPDVIEIGGAVKDAIHQGVESILACVSVWKRYRVLWRVQRVSEMSINLSMYECINVLHPSLSIYTQQIYHSLLQSSIS